MKKRFISLVAAAALVGGIASVATPAANAGTVAVKGDTAVNMYGFIRFEAGYAKDMASSIYHNVPVDTDSDDEHYETNANITRVGLTFNNADANVGGRIEGDFLGTNHEKKSGNFHLRRAYIKQTFDNFYLLAGQEWGLENDAIRTFSAAWESPAGFNGAARMPQIQLGGTFDLSGASVTAKLAFEDADYTGKGIAKEGSKEEDIVKKKRFPAIAAYLATDIDTGFGKPAEVFGYGIAAPLKIKVGNDTDDKTAYGFAVGATVPVSMVILQGEYLYGKGMNKLAGVDVDGMTPPSYFEGDAQKFYAWNAEAKINPMSCLSVAAGYDYLKFKDYNGYKMYTAFANISYKTTKYTTLTLEWDHAKIKDRMIDGEAVKDVDGDRYFFSYVYKF